MKKRTVNILLIILTTILILSLSTINTLAQSLNLVKQNQVSGKVVVINNATYNLEDIKIDVYRLDLYETLEYGQEYEHILEFSVYPNSNGEFSFSKPSNYCFVQIDTSSLNDTFGIVEGTKLLQPNDNSAILSISKINSFEYNAEKKQLQFIDDNNNKLQVSNNYTLSIDENEYNSQSLQIVCRIEDKKYESTVDLSNMNSVEKIDFLYENNLISEEDKIINYCELIESADDISNREFSEIISSLSEYCNSDNISSNLQSRINAISDSARVDYINEGTYTRGFFTIHYESGEFTNDELHSIYLTFNHAKASLCSTYMFKTPVLEKNEETYHVYLDSEGVDTGSWGLTVGWNNGDGTPASYIIAYIGQTADGENDIDEYTYGVFVHEFMHAVQCSYDSRGKHTSDYANFKETVANYASEIILDNPQTFQFINKFLNSPEYSLFDNAENTDYQYRIYGAMLYPLYLHSEYNSMNTIRQIFENFELETTENIYDALDNILVDNGSSFIESYITFTEHLYDVHANFSSHTSWQSTTKKTALLSTSTTYNLPKLSTMYFEDVAPASGNAVCTFTFGLNGGTGTSQVSLRSIYTSPGGTSSVYNRTFSNNARTVIVNLNSNAKICFLMSNITLDSTISFYTLETKTYS